MANNNRALVIAQGELGVANATPESHSYPFEQFFEGEEPAGFDLRVRVLGRLYIGRGRLPEDPVGDYQRIQGLVADVSAEVELRPKPGVFVVREDGTLIGDYEWAIRVVQGERTRLHFRKSGALQPMRFFLGAPEAPTTVTIDGAAVPFGGGQ